MMSFSEETKVRSVISNPRLKKTRFVVLFELLYPFVCAMLMCISHVIFWYNNMSNDNQKMGLPEPLWNGISWIVVFTFSLPTFPLISVISLPIYCRWAILLLPVFPALFIFTRFGLLQWCGIICHVVVAGYLIRAVIVCLFYYFHFDEMERNDNPGILEILAWMQAISSILSTLIFMVFAFLLYLDYRSLKKDNAGLAEVKNQF
jgi:hypothetical protein